MLVAESTIIILAPTSSLLMGYALSKLILTEINLKVGGWKIVVIVQLSIRNTLRNL